MRGGGVAKEGMCSGLVENYVLVSSVHVFLRYGCRCVQFVNSCNMYGCSVCAAALMTLPAIPA